MTSAMGVWRPTGKPIFLAGFRIHVSREGGNPVIKVSDLNCGNAASNHPALSKAGKSRGNLQAVS